MPRWTHKLRKWTTDMLDLPQDAIFDLPRITMIGNMQIYVENHRGVIFFSENVLQLALSKGNLEIRGKKLSIRAILTEEVFVEGLFEEIKYI